MSFAPFNPVDLVVWLFSNMVIALLPVLAGLGMMWLKAEIDFSITNLLKQGELYVFSAAMTGAGINHLIQSGKVGGDRPSGTIMLVILILAQYVFQGAARNKASKEGSKALPRQRVLCTNSKKPR